MMEKSGNTSTKLICFQQGLVFIGYLLLVVATFWNIG